MMYPEKGDPVFGIGKLDNLTLGKVEPGLLGLIYGPAGTGKTTLGAHYLFRGAYKNQNVCLLTYEPMSLFTKKFQRFKCYDSSWIKDGYISIFMVQNLLEHIGLDPDDMLDDDVDLLFDVIIQIISNMDIKRIVIDPGMPFIDLLVSTGKEARLTDLKMELVRMKASAFILYDLDLIEGYGSGQIPYPNLFDVIIRLDRDPSTRVPVNTLQIERWKDFPHSRNIYVVDLSGETVMMAPRLYTREGM